jgi:hypothetical protein
MPIVPNMARSHFEHIARIISALPDPSVREDVAVAFARELRCTNHTFNQAKFLAACGVPVTGRYERSPDWSRA